MAANLILFSVTWKMKSVFSLDGDYQPLKVEQIDDDPLFESTIVEDYSSDNPKKMSMVSVTSLDEDREKVRSLSVA